MAFYIKEFLNNPAGKGSAILNIQSTKNDFTKRYDKICKKIYHKTYFVKNDIYIIVNIPSSVDGIMYDVVLKFENTKKSTGNSLNDMSMQVFSNSPSFLYTYANAYDKQKLFIKECKSKLSSKMLRDIAKTRNPYGVLSYDFSVYSALFYIVNNGYTNISDLKISDYIECNLRTVLNNIKDADKLQKTRKLQKDYNKLVEQEKIKKNKNKSTNDKNDDNVEGIGIVKDSKKVSKISNVKKTKNNKKVKKI